MDARLEEALARHSGFSAVTWGPELGGLSSCNTALDADGEAYVLKRYGSRALAQLERLEGLAIFLEEQRFPAPVPLVGHDGRRHFSVRDATYGVFKRIDGRVLHREALGPQELEATAWLLGRLHRLGAAAGQLLPNRLQEIAPTTPAHRVPAQKIGAPHVGAIVRDLIAESLQLKQLILQDPAMDALADPRTGGDFVHGDFHNENVLYDSIHVPVGIVDYEESHRGQGVCDVVNFAQFACCNTGFSESNLRLGRHFVRAYSDAYGLEPQALRLGWLSFFARTASSVWLEERLLRGEVSFAPLVRRDILKMREFLQHGDAHLAALFP